MYGSNYLLLYFFDICFYFNSFSYFDEFVGIILFNWIVCSAPLHLRTFRGDQNNRKRRAQRKRTQPERGGRKTVV